jgi:hypothetical protein
MMGEKGNHRGERQMIKNQVLWLMIVSLCAVTVGGDAEPQGKKRKPAMFYQRPAVIVLKIASREPPVAGKNLEVVATVEGRLGMTSNLKISFDSSKDLRVETPAIEIPGIKAGEIREFRVSAAWDPKALTGDSCLRMVVEFTPDFAALLKVTSDGQAFPDPIKRKALVDRVKNEAVAGTRKIETCEFYPSIDIDLGQ